MTPQNVAIEYQCVFSLSFYLCPTFCSILLYALCMYVCHSWSMSVLFFDLSLRVKNKYMSETTKHNTKV